MAYDLSKIGSCIWYPFVLMECITYFVSFITIFVNMAFYSNKKNQWKYEFYNFKELMDAKAKKA
jgi:hypothetical protein